MNFCALDDAFQEISGAPSPGCNTSSSAKAARKEDRRKARRTRGPAQTYFDIPSKDSEVDVDRQQYIKAPMVPAMDGSMGSQESFIGRHSNSHAEMNQINQINNNPHYDKDPMESSLQNETRSKYMVVPMAIDNLSQKSKKFFGADPDTDSFADYAPDQADYKLQPDFMTAFEHAGVAKAGSMSTIPNPAANMYWKPTTVNGAQTSFMEHLPPSSHSLDHGEYSPKELMKRMDKIFARLDDLHQTSPEQMTSELLMFISSGVFVLFMMDLLVKKGSTMRF